MNAFKSATSRIPGVIVAHGLWKNGVHAVFPAKGTHGGIARQGLNPALATDYVYSIFEKVDRFLGDHGGWVGKRVLEIGPGDSLGTGLLALAHGALSYQAIDAFRVNFDQSREADVFARLRAKLTGEAAAAVAEVRPRFGVGVAGGDMRLAYANDLPIENAPARLGRGNYDVIFSNAVLEHVANPQAAALALSALLSPGGVMLHEIDLRSHQTYETHPLQFLEHPPWLWRLMSSHCGEPNRARLGDWLAHFAAAGLEAVKVEIMESYDPQAVAQAQRRLARPYRTMAPEQLAPAIVVLAFRLSR